MIFDHWTAHDDLPFVPTRGQMYAWKPILRGKQQTMMLFRREGGGARGSKMNSNRDIAFVSPSGLTVVRCGVTLIDTMMQCAIWTLVGGAYTRHSRGPLKWVVPHPGFLVGNRCRHSWQRRRRCPWLLVCWSLWRRTARSSWGAGNDDDHECNHYSLV